MMKYREAGKNGRGAGCGKTLLALEFLVAVGGKSDGVLF